MTAGYEGRLFVDGEFREAQSGRRFEVINPADESIVGMAADADGEDVALAVAAARRAADEGGWATDHAFRQRCLRQLQEGLRKESETARALQTSDTPFGGYGISGVGREHGEDGFREYLQAKTIASPAAAPGPAAGSAG